METINIINNFDSKIIKENILITNQNKLLDLIIKIFESGSINDIVGKKNVKEYFDKQKFINWELFLNLINLDSTFYSYKTKTTTNSLNYIIKSKSVKLMEFLLNLTIENYKIENYKIENYENEFMEEKINWTNVFFNIIKQMYSNDQIMNKLIDLVLIASQYKELLNKKTIHYLIIKCSETIILRLIENGLVKLDWEDDYCNNLLHWACKRNLPLLFNLAIENKLNLNKSNRGGKTPLHLTCIKNNFQLTKLLIENNVNLQVIDLESNTPTNYAIKYGNTELVKLLLNANIDDPNLFYQLIKYQNNELITYLIDNNMVDINNTNWFWTTLLFGNKKMYSQMITYSKKKLLVSIIDYFSNMYKYYDGRYVGDIFYNDDNIYAFCKY